MFYRIWRDFFKYLILFLFRTRILGIENMPKTGGVVIVSNHISNWDPLVVGSSVDRQVHFMAKESLFKVPIVGFLLRKWGMFPVRRGVGDRNAIRVAQKLLEQGNVLGLFPEGHRSKTGELGPFYPGAVSFALKGDAQVIPVVVMGPYKFFTPLHVRIGEPIDLSIYKKEKISSTTLEEAANHIRSQIQSLLISKP